MYRAKHSSIRRKRANPTLKRARDNNKIEAHNESTKKSEMSQCSIGCRISLRYLQSTINPPQIEVVEFGLKRIDGLRQQQACNMLCSKNNGAQAA